MKTMKINKVVLNDENLAGRKAKHVKGGPIYMNYASISGYSKPTESLSLNFTKIEYKYIPYQ